VGTYCHERRCLRLPASAIAYDQVFLSMLFREARASASVCSVLEYVTHERVAFPKVRRHEMIEHETLSIQRMM
jgi:hypothetical protein